MTGMQRGDAEFGRLLHDEIGGVALQQRECQPQIGLRRLGAESGRSTRRVARSRRTVSMRGGEFAVAAVEQQHRIARAAPHHGAKIMRLRRRGGDGIALGAELRVT